MLRENILEPLFHLTPISPGHILSKRTAEDRFKKNHDIIIQKALDQRDVLLVMLPVLSVKTVRAKFKPGARPFKNENCVLGFI